MLLKLRTIKKRCGHKQAMKLCRQYCTQQNWVRYATRCNISSSISCIYWSSAVIKSPATPGSLVSSHSNIWLVLKFKRWNVAPGFNCCKSRTRFSLGIVAGNIACVQQESVVDTRCNTSIPFNVSPCVRTVRTILQIDVNFFNDPSKRETILTNSDKRSGIGKH